MLIDSEAYTYKASDRFISDSDFQIIRIYKLIYAEKQFKFQCISIDCKEFGSYKSSYFYGKGHKCYK